MYKLYAFFDLIQIDSSMLNDLMQYLPEERAKKAMRYRRELDRTLSVMSYLLLLSVLYKEYGIHSPKIVCTKAGKPYLPDYPGIYFNISHCSLGCICAVSDVPVGVDIQDIRPFSWSVAKHCCSAAELQLLNDATDPNVEFIKIWTMKESYLKMKGTGVIGDLRTVGTTKLENKIKSFVINDCYVSVASAESFLEEEICLN